MKKHVIQRWFEGQPAASSNVDGPNMFESTTVETSDSILQLSREPFGLACNAVRKAVAYLIVFFFKRTLQSKNTLIKQGSNVIDFGTKNPRNGPLTNGSGLYLVLSASELTVQLSLLGSNGFHGI